MKKNIVFALGILLLTACNQNKVEPEEPKAQTVESVTKVPKKAPVKEVTAPIMQEASSEFIPEHIRRSRIEVVKHY